MIIENFQRIALNIEDENSIYLKNDNFYNPIPYLGLYRQVPNTYLGLYRQVVNQKNSFQMKNIN